MKQIENLEILQDITIYVYVRPNNGTAADRAKLWINGVRETSFSTQTNMSGDQFVYR